MGILRKLGLAALVALLVLALGLAGTMDYEDRCASLSPTSLEEVR